MSLKDRLQKNIVGSPGLSVQTLEAGTSEEEAEAAQSKGEWFAALRAKVHSELVEAMDLDPSQELDKTEIALAANKFLEKYLLQEQIPMSRSERDLMVRQLVEEIMGLGPLEPLLKDPTIADILINGPRNIYVERFGKLQKTKVQFADDAHLMHIIDRIVSAVGRRVDEKNPMVDARLKDGSRFNAIIAPLSLDGPAVSIRKFKQDAGTLEKLINWKSMTPEMAKILEAAVVARMNIIISGGTGAGKTTLLNSLSALIPEDERILTIEDSAELQLQQDHVVRLETRPANIEGEGAITARQLVINALRMRPDRIVVGECRGAESLDMLQAMNTGHDGSLTTLHANTPRDALARIETMCMMVDNPLPSLTVKQQIASAVNIVVQASRLQDGSRKVTSIQEIVGMEGDVICMQEIYKFAQYGIDENGKVIGQHTATGVRPKFAEVAKTRGIDLPGYLFEAAPPPPPDLKDFITQQASRSETSAPAAEGTENRGHTPSAGGNGIGLFAREDSQRGNEAANNLRNRLGRK